MASSLLLTVQFVYDQTVIFAMNPVNEGIALQSHALLPRPGLLRAPDTEQRAPQRRRRPPALKLFYIIGKF